MPSQIELWVGDQLHDILGLSEKVLYTAVLMVYLVSCSLLVSLQYG